MVEASGRNYRNLQVSLESMEVFTTSMEAPTTSMEGSVRRIVVQELTLFYCVGLIQYCEGVISSL